MAPPGADTWERFLSTNAPTTVLFQALMRSPGHHARFTQLMMAELSGRFAEEVVLARLDSMEALLLPEMERHVARWRMPEDPRTWQEHVEVLRDFARDRPESIRRMLAPTSTSIY
jgi:hypothetical protein